MVSVILQGSAVAAIVEATVHRGSHQTGIEIGTVTETGHMRRVGEHGHARRVGVERRMTIMTRTGAEKGTRIGGERENKHCRVGFWVLRLQSCFWRGVQMFASNSS